MLNLKQTMIVKAQVRKKLLIGVVVFLTVLPGAIRGANSRTFQLSPQEMSDWRYPAILCRDAAQMLAFMMELEKTLPGATDFRWKADPERAFITVANDALLNQHTYETVLGRKMVATDGFRTSTITWKLYWQFKKNNYKLVNNEKLPLDAFDWCVSFLDNLLSHSLN